MTAEEKLEKLTTVLNTRAKCIEDCCCSNCEETREKIRKGESEKFVCSECGYTGVPCLIECGCYDYGPCPGGDKGRGPGCCHGFGVCPICDDGDQLYDIAKKLCSVIRKD